MAGVTDPNIVHETMAKLDASTIYLESEVEGLVHDYLAHKGNNALTKWITPARDRFRDRERPALDHNNKRTLDELELFRKDVGTFLRQYDFLSQIVDYEEDARRIAELERENRERAIRWPGQSPPSRRCRSTSGSGLPRCVRSTPTTWR